MPTRAEQQRIDAECRLVELARPFLPHEPTAHCFARLSVEQRGRRTDVLLATRGRAESVAERPRLLIADFRTSPYAEIFFSAGEGERYQLATATGTVTGKVVARTLFGFERGELVEVTTPAGLFSRREGGGWRKLEGRLLPVLAPRPATLQKRRTSLVDVQLDASQKSSAELPAGRALLLLGEAGHGKTTVALHRLARLSETARRRNHEQRALVIVPAEGLEALLELLLKELGLEVEVRLYDRFAGRQARRLFRDMPRRESRNASAGVIRFKRSPGLGVALDVIARRPPGRIDDDRDARERPTRALARWADLQHLFGDRALLALAASASPEPFGEHVLAEVLEHTRVQFTRSTEREHSDVEARKLMTLDGEGIDEGTPLEDASSIDAEDYAVLFELDRRRALVNGRTPTAPTGYDAIVLDEAQELAPFELALVGRSLAAGGTLTVAGDADQQLDPAASFESWEATMRSLGAERYERRVLEVGYRCPPGVARLARRLRAAGPADGRPAPGQRPEKDVARAVFTTEYHLVDWLTDALNGLRKRDPSAALAVICRTAPTARRLSELLRFGAEHRLVLDGSFLHHAGTNVTSLEQVKGLEFDFVIVPDATPGNYPDTPAARRALYVAVTRARHELVLAGVGALTSIAELL